MEDLLQLWLEDAPIKQLVEVSAAASSSAGRDVRTKVFTGRDESNGIES